MFRYVTYVFFATMLLLYTLVSEEEKERKSERTKGSCFQCRKTTSYFSRFAFRRHPLILNRLCNLRKNGFPQADGKKKEERKEKQMNNTSNLFSAARPSSSSART